MTAAELKVHLLVNVCPDRWYLNWPKPNKKNPTHPDNLSKCVHACNHTKQNWFFKQSWPRSSVHRRLLIIQSVNYLRMLQFWDRLYVQLKRGTEITRERSWEKNPQKQTYVHMAGSLTKCSSSVTCSLNRSAAGDQEGQELRSCGKYKGRSRGFPRVNELLRFSFDLEILENIHIGPPKALLNIGGKHS